MIILNTDFLNTEGELYSGNDQLVIVIVLVLSTIEFQLVFQLLVVTCWCTFACMCDLESEHKKHIVRDPIAEASWLLRWQQVEFGSGLQALVLARHYVLEAEIWTPLPVCGARASAPQYCLPDFSLKKHRLKKQFISPVLAARDKNRFQSQMKSVLSNRDYCRSWTVGQFSLWLWKPLAVNANSRFRVDMADSDTFFDKSVLLAQYRLNDCVIDCKELTK